MTISYRTVLYRTVARFAPAVLLASSLVIGSAHAADKIQIGLSTKAWFPSFVAQLTQQQGFFKAEGVDAQLTVYQSGSEAFTAIAAGAADVISSNPSIVANGRAAGVKARLVALLATHNFGWQIMVPKNSPIKQPKDLAGKKVGITAAGSNTDLLAGWAKKRYGVDFETIPLGGGGLVPNLISGNVSAIVVYPPLSYQVALEGNGDVLVDFSKEMPAHFEAGWAASEAYISDQPATLRKAMKAMLRGVEYIKKNPDKVIPMIAKYDGIPEAVAKVEYESTFLHLSKDGKVTKQLVEQSLDIYGRKAKGQEIDPDALFSDKFTPAAGMN